MYISSNGHNFGQLFCNLSTVSCYEVAPNKKTNQLDGSHPVV